MTTNVPEEMTSQHIDNPDPRPDAWFEAVERTRDAQLPKEMKLSEKLQSLERKARQLRMQCRSVGSLPDSDAEDDLDEAQRALARATILINRARHKTLGALRESGALVATDNQKRSEQHSEKCYCVVCYTALLDAADCDINDLGPSSSKTRVRR